MICTSTNVTRGTPTKTGSASSSRRAMKDAIPLGIVRNRHKPQIIARSGARIPAPVSSSPRLDPDLVHVNPIQLHRVPDKPVHVRLVHQRGLVVVPKEPRRIRDDVPLCLLDLRRLWAMLT